MTGAFEVPPSKSIHQRALVLAALADGDSVVETRGPAPGDDVRGLEAALGELGRWEDGALGRGRRSLAIDLGEGATGFRFAVALAALRSAGARTLVRGRPSLLGRPHGDLLRAMRALGGHVVRKASGAVRVIGGGMRGGELVVSGRRSSQYASALLLVAPRLGGLDLRFTERPVSAPYLDLTAEVLEAFGADVEASGLREPGGRVRVGERPPRGARFAVPPDASAAAAWWTAAALTGGRVEVAGLARASRQADAALLPVLERMGCVVEDRSGSASVAGPPRGLRAPGEVDLRDAPDLLPLLAVLAARAEGATRLVGAGHARWKETNRVEGLARALAGVGGRVRVEADALAVDGGPLHGGVVDARGDHRLAFAFGVLGLVVPGVVLRGAQSTAKSHPGFLRDLSRAAG